MSSQLTVGLLIAAALIGGLGSYIYANERVVDYERWPFHWFGGIWAFMLLLIAIGAGGGALIK